MPYEPYTVRPRLKNRNSLAVKIVLLVVAAVALATAGAVAAFLKALP